MLLYLNKSRYIVLFFIYVMLLFFTYNNCLYAKSTGIYLLKEDRRYIHRGIEKDVVIKILGSPQFIFNSIDAWCYYYNDDLEKRKYYFIIYFKDGEILRYVNNYANDDKEFKWDYYKSA